MPTCGKEQHSNAMEYTATRNDKCEEHKIFGNNCYGNKPKIW